jgi:hypothetical protein
VFWHGIVRDNLLGDGDKPQELEKSISAQNRKIAHFMHY